jgi:hypothetical protein
MMKNINKNIDKMVSKILNEEINRKIVKITETFKQGEWNEVEVKEKLHGGQKKLDVAKPKGKLTSADFEKLRKNKSSKKEMDEVFYYEFDDENGNQKSLNKAEKLSNQEPTYVGRGLSDNKPGKMFASFGDEKWYDDDDVEYSGDFDFDFDEEEFDDFESFDEKYKGKQKWFASGNQGKMFFDKYKEVGGSPLRVRSMKEIGEAETEEGNAFSGALANAKKSGKDSFTVGGKKYNVKESKKTLSLTENELIDMIENIVLEQKVKDSAEKENISKKSPEGLKKTMKVQDTNKKENEDYAKEVVEKMKNYLKGGSNGQFDMNPESFPKSNYQFKKDEKMMKYHPSQAVDEYIEAFAYPGMTNLVYDEIKPEDEKISKYLEGDSTTGNAEKDKDGKALGNVVPSEVGKRFKKNFDENLYGAEQMNVSYKRQPQPVDVGGSKKMEGSLKSIRKGSTNKASKIMNQLESTNKNKKDVVNEEMNKMKDLISYNRKTQ